MDIKGYFYVKIGVPTPKANQTDCDVKYTCLQCQIRGKKYLSSYLVTKDEKT